MRPTPQSRAATGRWRAIGVLLAVSATGMVVALDAGSSRSAQPPAELASVIPVVGDSANPTISGDGAFVAFDYDDFRLDGSTQLGFVRDRATPKTDAAPYTASTPRPYQRGLVIARDGCHLAYIDTSPLSDNAGQYTGDSVVAADRCTTSTPRRLYAQSRAQAASGLRLSGTHISDHGRYVTVGSGQTVVWLDRDADGNGVLDDTAAVVATSQTQTTGGALGDDLLTNKVAISQLTSGYSVQVFLWDPTKAPADPSALTLVSAADGTSTPLPGLNAYQPAMTPDGRFVAFVADDNFPGGAAAVPAQVMVRDVANSRTAVVSRNGAGLGGNGDSLQPSISADGTQIAFGTTATDLLAPPVGGISSLRTTTSLDLLVATSTSGFFATVGFDRVSVTPSGDAIDPVDVAMTMQHPVISSSGRWVAFESTFASELQTGVPPSTVPAAGYQDDVYVIGRPTTISIGALDFGPIAVGATSNVLSTVVSNTGNSSVFPASITTGGDFTIAPGGTCAVGTWLSPGQSCTVAVQFTPSAAGARSNALTLAENGFAPVSVSAALSGSGVAPPTTTAASTTTTTTIASTTTVIQSEPPPASTAAPTTTAVTTTTTTIPRVPKLTISPNAGSFGTSLVGLATSPITFAVISTGSAAVIISDLQIAGVDPGAFSITDQRCIGVTLPAGSSCSVTVQFAPATAGPLTATLTAISAAVNASAQLDGSGTLQPTIRLLPDVVSLGDVAIVVGSGFEPNTVVQLRWSDSGATIAATTDASGALQAQIPVRTDEPTGPRTLVAVDQPGIFAGVSTPALIVDRSAQPPTMRNPALTGLAALVVRG